MQERSGPERALAFTLFSVFHSLAQQQDGEPVTVSEGQEIFCALDGPISSSLERLENGSDEQTLFELILALINAYVPPPKLNS